MFADVEGEGEDLRPVRVPQRDIMIYMRWASLVQRVRCCAQ